MKTAYYLLTVILVVVLVFGVTPTVAAKGKPGGGGGNPPPPPTFGEPEIAFINNGTEKALMLLDADHNVKELISAHDWIVNPSWAPSGDRIAFSSTLGGNGWELYVIDADGRNLTSLAPNEGLLSFPAWSPDGRWIAYTNSNPTRNDKDIFVVDVSCADSGSSDCVFHFDTPGYRENHPAWSSSGDWLAVKAEVESGDFSPVTYELVVYTFTDDDPSPVLGPPQVLTDRTNPVLSRAEGEGGLQFPAWSKEDDSWLAVVFRGDADINRDLFLIDTANLDAFDDTFTLDAFNLTNCPECDVMNWPSWSPCNSQMVVSTRDPNNRKNTNYKTLAFLNIQYDLSGIPVLQSISYLPRQSQGDDYIHPDWKRGICAPLP